MNAEKAAQKDKSKRAISGWRKLVTKLLTRQRLVEKYSK
jgi:hypothetical protein